MGRESEGVGRRQLASATMPHSGCDRRPVGLCPPLCRYSQHGTGLRHPVRTCLTHPRHCAAYPCTFLPCRTLGMHGRRPSDTVRPLTGARLKSFAPSTPYLIRRHTLCTLQSCHADDWSHRTRTRPGSNRRTREDDNHARRHAPQHSTTGTTIVLPRIGRGKGGDRKSVA